MKKKTKRLYLVWTPGHDRPRSVTRTLKAARWYAAVWNGDRAVIIPIDIPVSAIPKVRA